MLDSRELSAVIDRYVRSLPSRQKYIFMSRYYVNRSVKEIAEKLDVSVSTVNKELSLIRSGLKEKITKEGYML